MKTPPLVFLGPLSMGRGYISVYRRIGMRKFIAAFLAVCAGAYANVAYAGCSTHTYTVNGKMVTCTTCCYGNNCTTNCF